jgi:hypothetical protein
MRSTEGKAPGSDESHARGAEYVSRTDATGTEHAYASDGNGDRINEPTWDGAVRWASAKWLGLTRSSMRAWVEPGLAGARELAVVNERLATAVADAVLDRLRGQTIDWMVGGHPLRAVVIATQVRRRGMAAQLRVDLGDVTWGEWRFERASATAASIRLDPSSPSRVKASGVDVVALTKLEPLLALLRQHLRARSLGIDPAGRITLLRRRFGLRAFIEPPVIERGVVTAHLHAVSWCGVRLALPARMRPRLSSELPPLPLGVSIAEARLHGEDVHFRLAIPALTGSMGRNCLRPG